MIAWLALAVALFVLTILTVLTVAAIIVARKAKPMLAMFAPKK